jgi:hypothetical protein
MLQQAKQLQAACGVAGLCTVQLLQPLVTARKCPTWVDVSHSAWYVLLPRAASRTELSCFWTVGGVASCLNVVKEYMSSYLSLLLMTVMLSVSSFGGSSSRVVQWPLFESLLYPA